MKILNKNHGGKVVFGCRSGEAACDGENRLNRKLVRELERAVELN